MCIDTSLDLLFSAMNAIRTDCHVVPCRRAARRAAAGPPQLHILVDISCRAGFMPCGAGRDLEDPREMCVSKLSHGPARTVGNTPGCVSRDEQVAEQIV